MTQSELPNSGDQLDELLAAMGEQEDGQLDETEDVPTEDSAQVTLTHKEYEELKAGNLRHADYTRKRQQEAARVRELEDKLTERQGLEQMGLNDDDGLSEDLEDLPESVASRVRSVDSLKKELADLRAEREQAQLRDRAQELISTLDSLKDRFPALESKEAKFVVMAYASQVLNNPTEEGFKQAATALQQVFSQGNKAKARQAVANVQERKSVPTIGAGGSAPVSSVRSPKTVGEANNLALKALAQIK